MSVLKQIEEVIKNRRMLEHPFYRDWMAGCLTLPQLQRYAEQYAPFVDSFPRFVSATHALCDDSRARRLLAENLADEEGLTHSAPHPKLWADFARGLGGEIASDQVVRPKARALEQSFKELCRSSYVEGLCALYAYESQIPEIARAKIEGLRQHYRIEDEKSLKFFSVHETADVYHSKACRELIDDLDAAATERAVVATQRACDALWDFLTEARE